MNEQLKKDKELLECWQKKWSSGQTYTMTTECLDQITSVLLSAQSRIERARAVEIVEKLKSETPFTTEYVALEKAKQEILSDN